MSYLVFDLEVETHESHKRKASPFDQRNWVVARGWKLQGATAAFWEYYPTHDRTTYQSIPTEVTHLVGFNIKFDLLWEMAQNNPDLIPFFKRGGKIWDCQYAEYLIMAQQDGAQMASLDSCAPKYGGTVKIDEVKLLWKAGVKTSEIQEDLLIDYLVGTAAEDRNGGDIRNTELVFLGQIAKAQEQGQLNMIADRMDGLLATTYMEFAGLKVDVAEAGLRLIELNTELTKLTQELHTHLPELPFEFNWASRTHVSCMIFGGTIKYEKQTGYLDAACNPARSKAYEQWPISRGIAYHPTALINIQDTFLSGVRKGELKFKKQEVLGALKTKWQDFYYTFPQLTEPKPEWKTATTDAKDQPLYSTGSDTIVELGLRNIPFLKALAQKQKLDKEIGTYYVRTDPKKGHVGMLTCVQPADHLLHHKLNHTSTVTTRLSSSDPNLQNLPRGDKSQVKKMFVSRFGAEGAMLEIDYSQLEVVVQGVLSGDTNLCRDLNAKIDFHCKRVAAKHNITYEQALDWCKNGKHPDFKAGKRERTKVKEFSFQRAYGAGAAAISDATGMDIEEVKTLIVAEDIMYPGVIDFNARVEKSVLQSASPFQAVNVLGQWQTFRRGFWKAPTGTLYSWRTYEAPDFMRRRGVLDTFSPPELKNYPVQGTGGEFVQAMLGLLWRHFVSTDFYGGQAFLVNTVHDCVWADCHISVRDQVAEDMQRIMQTIPEFYNTRYGMNITVPFPVDVETGLNMYELSHWSKH